MMLLMLLFLPLFLLRLGVLLGGVLEERACDGTTDAADDAMAAHFVSTEGTCCTASHGS